MQLWEIIHRESVYLWYYFSLQLKQILPYFTLGIILGSLISVFGKSHILRTFEKLGERKLGALGIIPASILGLVSPLCMYATIPVAASFSKSGIRHDWLAAFMMSSVLLNPQLIIYSSALGPTVLLIRIISCFLCGCLAGFLVGFISKGNPFFDFKGINDPHNHDTDPNIINRFIKNVGRNIKATAPLFFFGLILSALFQRYVPTEWFSSLFGKNNEGFGVLMAATVGVPLYACCGATVPLIREWLVSGMSMGSAAAFMITGPSTKITNLCALKIVLGRMSFLIYLAFGIFFSVLTGLIVNIIF